MLIKIKDIKIKDEFEKTPPKGWKMARRWKYYRQTGELEADIVIDKDNYLVDGYTSYLIAVADGIKKAEVQVV